MAEKILLVDDEKDFLEIMSERLAARGVEVVASTSAEDALEKLDDDLFDAVVLDLQMPGMDGIDALKAIKEKRPEMQVILLTGHGTVETGVEAIKLGAMDFIEKPADIETLNEKIKKAKQQKMLIVEKMHHDRMLEIFQRFGM